MLVALGNGNARLLVVDPQTHRSSLYLQPTAEHCIARPAIPPLHQQTPSVQRSRTWQDRARPPHRHVFSPLAPIPRRCAASRPPSERDASRCARPAWAQYPSQVRRVPQTTMKHAVSVLLCSCAAGGRHACAVSVELQWLHLARSFRPAPGPAGVRAVHTMWKKLESTLRHVVGSPSDPSAPPPPKMPLRKTPLTAQEFDLRQVRAPPRPSPY